MKNPFLLNLLAIIFAFNSIFAQTTDEINIKKIIEAETTSFSKESLSTAVSRYWLLDEYTLRCISFLDGSTYQHKAADLVSSEEIPPADHAVFKKYNYKIHVNGTMAFVTNDQDVMLLHDQSRQYMHEMWVLELVEGAWKIHLFTSHHYVP